MKKKFVASSKDKKEWTAFTKQMGTINYKKADFLDQNIEINQVPKLDLHGFSLDESNRLVKKFILASSDHGYKKLLIVTGKGSRSKSYNNPYISEKLGVLRYSVPEFIKNDENLSDKINRISQANTKDGAEGAIYIFLKKNKKL